MRDSKAFRERFLRWKNGEQVYDRGRIIYARFGLDGEEETDAIQRRLTPLEYLRETWRTTAEKNAERFAKVMALNYAEVGPLQHVPQLLLEYYRKKDLTAKWVALKKALEQATDEMMAAFIDPRYIVGGAVAGAAISGAWRAAKAAVTGSKLYKSYKISKAINKAVKQGAYVLSNEAVFPGQVGWAPKTRVSGYHASNEENLQPDFWFNGWALQRGAPRGFYIAGGDAPEGGFLSKRPYVHSVETEFEKPMVQVGDIPTQPGVKNTTRNSIELLARSMGADGIIYLDIKDNQLAHLHIAKTLHPDVKVNVLLKAIGSTEYDVAEEVGSFGGNVVKQNKVYGRGVRQNTNGTINVSPKTFKYGEGLMLPPKFGSDALVDSEGNVNMRNVVKMVRDIYKTYPNAKNYKEIINSSGNLYEHIRDVVKSAQEAPIPKGYTRQDLVKAALLHDIGKVINLTYSGHARASLNIMDRLGIDTSEDIRRAIKVHMQGSSPEYSLHHGSIGKESPLARALHFVDVVRNKYPMTNAKEGAYYLFRNLLYPTEEEYKINGLYSWDTDYQLENIINPILRAYGYKEILLGLPPQEARRLLLQKILQHRRFVRGLNSLGDANDPGNQHNLLNAINQFVRREGRMPTTDELYLLGHEYFKEHNTGHGTRGMNSYLHKMELPLEEYMSLYTSNSSEVPMTYRRSSGNPYAIQILEMPVLDNPEWSLAELWGYNDYPMVYSPHDSSTLKPEDFNSSWRRKILPYVLDNGTGGKPIIFNTKDDKLRFLDQKQWEYNKEALEEYDIISSKLKPVFPAEIEPSDFMQAVIPLFGKPFANHFHPTSTYFGAVPFPANGLILPYTAPLKSEIMGFYGKRDMYGATTMAATNWERYTLEINNVLKKHGIDKDFSPVVYSRLSDKATVLKYPRAFSKLYHKVLNSDLEYFIPVRIPLMTRRGKVLPPLYQYRGMTLKLIEAHNNANKIKYVDGYAVNAPYFDEDGNAFASNTKYVPDTKKLLLKYLNEYFKDIKLARSKDAFIRRAVAAYKNLNRRDSWVEDKVMQRMKEAEEEYEKLLSKGFILPSDYQHSYPFPLWSRDGYRVFVTEHGSKPGSNSELNYIFVGKRGKKVLKANKKFKFNDVGTRYDRGHDGIGDIYPGLTRNAK